MPYIHDSPTPSPTEKSSSIGISDPVEERRRVHHESDVVIVGAGILGSALAVALANQGRSVILLERSLKEPDRIVGELLQPGGVAALEKLGLRHCLDDIDSIVEEGYDVIYYGKEVEIPYPLLNPRDKTSTKRSQGRSFHHGRFIQRLRQAALSHPNITVFETNVTSIITSSYNQGHVLGVESLTRTTSKDYFFGALTVICDGYNSRFRKQFSHHTPISRSKFWGLELHDAVLPMSNHGIVCLSRNAPVLLYQIGTHETRALVDIPENTPTASIASGGVKSHLREVVLPTLPASVQPSFLDAIETRPLRSMPNSFLPPTTNKTPGLILLGDALNMRHPLTGGGMTVALTDVVLLSSLLSPTSIPNLESTPQVLSALRTFHWRRKHLTSVINILAQALYSLFAANDPQLFVLQRGCFRYFQLGGACIDGPIGLLGGLTPQPFVLFYHFFSVAIYGIGIMLWEDSSWWEWILFPILISRSLMVFWKACVVLFPYIFAELRS